MPGGDSKFQGTTAAIADIDNGGSWDFAFGTYTNKFYVVTQHIKAKEKTGQEWLEYGRDNLSSSIYDPGKQEGSRGAE